MEYLNLELTKNVLILITQKLFIQLYDVDILGRRNITFMLNIKRKSIHSMVINQGTAHVKLV